jgi:hypothetical protein
MAQKHFIGAMSFLPAAFWAELVIHFNKQVNAMAQVGFALAKWANACCVAFTPFMTLDCFLSFT